MRTPLLVYQAVTLLNRLPRLNSLLCAGQVGSRQPRHSVKATTTTSVQAWVLHGTCSVMQRRRFVAALALLTKEPCTTLCPTRVGTFRIIHSMPLATSWAATSTPLSTAHTPAPGCL